MRNTGSLQHHRARLDALTNTNESRQHQSDGASCRGRRADAAQPRSANFPDQGVGTQPCRLLIPLLQPKVTSRERNASLCTILGDAGSFSLLEVSQHLALANTTDAPTHNTHTSPSSTLPQFYLPPSLFLELNVACVPEWRKKRDLFDSQLWDPCQPPGRSAPTPTDPEVGQRHELVPRPLTPCLSFSHRGNWESKALVPEIMLMAFGEGMTWTLSKED